MSRGGQTIRRARPDEATCLSELAFHSKAYWGYDAAFMEACRDDLTLTPEALVKPHYLLEQDGHTAGFYNLAETPDGVYLHNLFVAAGVYRAGRRQTVCGHTW